MIKNIKKRLPRKFKNWLYNKWLYQKLIHIVSYYNGYHYNKNKYIQMKSLKKIFLIGSPEHDNLGDHAIAYAEILLLKHNFTDHIIIEITELDFIKHLKCLKKYSNIQNIFVLNGGGNMGVDYFFDENIRRQVVKSFPYNKIIIFPQTIDFGKTEYGYQELEKSRRIYKSHNSLTIVAREITSYDLMKKIFIHNNVLLAPDIVLYLNETEPKEIRNGVLLCIRKDKESVFDSDQKQTIETICRSVFNKVEFTNTCSDHCITIEKRKEELLNKWEQFKKAEVIITDRLHGMIFAAITSTPCIALGNYNHKIKSSFQWLSHLRYIKFAENINEIFIYLEELKNEIYCEYDNSFTLDYYQKIINAMKM